MLDQNAHEPFDGPQNHPVQHDRPVLLAVLADIVQVEPLRKREIALNRRALPFPFQRVLQFEIDLRSVEGPVAFVDLVGHAVVLQGAFQGTGGQIPIFVGSDGMLRSRGKLHLVFKTEDAHGVADEIGNGPDLAVELPRRTQDMGVVLRELPHPRKAVEHTGLFMAVDRPQLEVTQR